MDLKPHTIDVWDVGTFDPELMALLQTEAELVQGYANTEQRIFLEYDHAPGGRPNDMRPSNPWAPRFQQFKEAIGRTMVSRTIRAWHYTRLTDDETKAMLREGIHLSTPATLIKRLAALVDVRQLDAATAEAVYKASRFHSELEIRQNRFWMVSHPLPVDDGGVEGLLAYWGGEVASFRPDLPELIEPLAKIGRPRVVEVAVPFSSAAKHNGYTAGGAVVATFGRSLGCVTSKHIFGLYATATLPASSVLAIHSEHDPHFTKIGRGFPPRFVDVNIRHWAELTGEKD